MIADDHAVMRSGLRMLLQAQPDFDVVAEVGTVSDVLVAVRSHRPTVLLLDLNMPGGSSVRAIGQLQQIAPRTLVIVLSMETDSAYRRESYAAGAVDFVLKDQAASDLVHAIRRALRRSALA